MGSSAHLPPASSLGYRPGSYLQARHGKLSGRSQSPRLRRLRPVALLVLPVAVAFASYHFAETRAHARMNQWVHATGPALARAEQEVTQLQGRVNDQERSLAQLQERNRSLQARSADQGRESAQDGKTLVSMRGDLDAIGARVTELKSRLSELTAKSGAAKERADRLLAENTELTKTKASLQTTLDEHTTKLNDANDAHASEVDLAKVRR